MNQGVEIDVSVVMQSVRDSGLLVSLCTIKTQPDDPASFDAGGALFPDAVWPPLEGHIDIPCTAPPIQTTDNVTPQEIKSMQEIEAKSLLHVLLDNYYPDLQGQFNEGMTCRAEIDGIDYDVVNVESDSQHQMTRLAVELVTI